MTEGMRVYRQNYIQTDITHSVRGLLEEQDLLCLLIIVFAYKYKRCKCSVNAI